MDEAGAKRREKKKNTRRRLLNFIISINNINK